MERDSKRQLRLAVCSFTHRRSITSRRLPLCVTMNARETKSVHVAFRHAPVSKQRSRSRDSHRRSSGVKRETPWWNGAGGPCSAHGTLTPSPSQRSVCALAPIRRHAARRERTRRTCVCAGSACRCCPAPLRGG